MAKKKSQQALRQEAARRRFLGDRVCDISRDLNRNSSWVNKWFRHYLNNPATDFADRPRRPRRSPRRLTGEIEQAILGARRELEAGATAATRYGLIGAKAIRSMLTKLGIEPLPSLSSIQRVLARGELTHSRARQQNAPYYPWIEPWCPNALHATDIITKHLRGGTAIQHFHTIDVLTHAVALTPSANKTSGAACSHLLQSWETLGLPWIHQFDNESAFSGGSSHKRVLGAVVRLCLYVGIEPLFIPFYEAKRNHWIETFHALWNKAFWQRDTFNSLADVLEREPQFLSWYQTTYQPPSLNGLTPDQRRANVRIPAWQHNLTGSIPEGRLPLTKGRIHLMRCVGPQGVVSVFNEKWFVGKKWIGLYVRATINTATRKISFWHKTDASSNWGMIKSLNYKLNEPVQAVTARFRRKSLRCLDQLPG